MNAIEEAAEDYRERYRPDTEGWWVLFPAWMMPRTEQIMRDWYKLTGLFLGNIRGFEFWGGPRYTYDQEEDAWYAEDANAVADIPEVV